LVHASGMIFVTFVELCLQYFWREMFARKKKENSIKFIPNGFEHGNGNG
jgi:hypothetical protein